MRRRNNKYLPFSRQEHNLPPWKWLKYQINARHSLWVFEFTLAYEIKHTKCIAHRHTHAYTYICI